LDPVVKPFGSTLIKEVREKGRNRCEKGRDVKEVEGSVLVMGKALRGGCW
jgi:hypothetical protein